jgi:hypothetical protein
LGQSRGFESACHGKLLLSVNEKFEVDIEAAAQFHRLILSVMARTPTWKTFERANVGVFLKNITVEIPQLNVCEKPSLVVILMACVQHPSFEECRIFDKVLSAGILWSATAAIASTRDQAFSDMAIF